jgi:DNA-binding transcriptional LysR family regulator
MTSGVQYSLRQLEYMVVAAEEGTMSAAAQRCRISQSAISLAIANLERCLEVQLFLRHARGLMPTDAGRAVLASARRLLDQAETLQADARSMGETLSGRLVVGCLPALTRPLVPEILREFPRRYPSVEIDLLEGRTDEVHTWLLEGRCEVGLTYDLGDATAFRRIELYRSRPHVLLPPGHSLADAVDVGLSDLQEDALIMHGAPVADEYYRQLFWRAGIEPRPRYRTITLESARALVRAGVGYTLLMHHPAAPEESVPLRHEGDGLPVVVSLPAGAQPTRRARAFVAVARDVLSPSTGVQVKGDSIAGTTS